MIRAKRLFVIILSVFLAMIFLPFGYAINTGLGSANYIYAGIFWEYVDSFYFTGFRILTLDAILSSLPYWVFKIVFGVSLVFYYVGGPKRTISELVGIGILSELIPLMLSIPAFLGTTNIFLLPYDVVYPLPFLLILVYTLTQIVPKSEFSDPWKDEN